MGYKPTALERRSRKNLPAPAARFATRPGKMLLFGLVSSISAVVYSQMVFADTDPPAPDLETIIKESQADEAKKASPRKVGSDSSGASSNQQSEDANQHPAAITTAELSEELERKVEDLESHFFGHIYRAEPAEKRLVRLERFVFGTEAGGPYAIRISHIASTLTVENPDGTKREIKLHQKDAQMPQVSQGQQQQIQAPQHQSPAKSQDSNENNGSSQIPNIVDAQEEQVIKTPLESSAPFMPGSRPVTMSQQTTNPQDMPEHAKQQGKILVLQVTKSTFATPGNPGESIKELDVAIRVHPSDADLMFERAKAWIQMDKLSSALNDLSDAIMHDPNKSAYYLARAWCYKKLGNTYLAADDVKSARFVDPSLPAKIDLLQSSPALTRSAE